MSGIQDITNNESVIQLFCFSAYSSRLVGIKKDRYVEKLIQVKCDGLYTFTESQLSSGSAVTELFPDVTHLD